MDRITPILNRRDAPAVSLLLAVTDDQHQPLQGNVFVSLQHDSSGTMWRTLQWNRSTQSFRFSALPFGAFSYRVWTSVDRLVAGQIVLDAPGTYHQAVVLPPKTARARLELPIRNRLAAWRSRLASNDRDDDVSIQREHVPVDSAAEILLDLMVDPLITASIVQPIAALGITDAVWRFIEAHTRPGSSEAIVTARARFLVITRCVAMNQALRRRLAPQASDAQIWTTLLRVVATIEDADLDDVFLWAARVYFPETALLEEFARAWADRFNGVNNLRAHVPGPPTRRRRPTVAVPDLPPPPAAVADPAVARISTPVLADIAHIVHASGTAR